MTQQLTPGPWKTNAQERSYAPVGYVVGHGQNGFITGHINNRADALAMAAAPEMLSVLESILARQDNYLTEEDAALARAAIAKARGQS